MTQKSTGNFLGRIADALERMSAARAPNLNFQAADAFIWHPETRGLTPVKR